METQQLKIGLFAPSLAWQALLEQIGVDYTIVSDDKGFLPHIYSALIVNRVLFTHEIDAIKEYCRTGGAVIDAGYCIQRILGGTVTHNKNGYILPGDLPFAQYPAIIDIYSSIPVYSKARYCRHAVGIERFGEGIISFWGLTSDAILFDTRSKQKMFYGKMPRYPHEETSCVSKGELSRLFFSLLKYVHLCRNIPFVHKWFFPDKARNVFLFRIDSDYGSRQKLKQWYDLAKAHAVTLTWFLHVAAHKDWLSEFTNFKGHEIAVHGYNHITTKNIDAQRQNILIANNILKQYGFDCKGYAAPYGLWNNAVHTVSEEMGFIYSSEFSYLYDSLPLFPVVQNRTSTVLQIPIHPICIGSLINARADTKEMKDYFTQEFNRNLSNLNPVIFYDHVLHNHADVLREIFTLAQSHKLPSLTFCQFAQWWNHRAKAAYSAQVNSDQTIQIRYSALNIQSALCVWITENTYILSDEKQSLNLTAHPISAVSNHATPVETKQLKATRVFNGKLCLFSLLNNLFWRKYS